MNRLRALPGLLDFATIRTMKPDAETQARRRAVVHLVELAMRAEHDEIDDEDRAALDEAAKVLDAHRRSVEWRMMQGKIKFLVEQVLVPLYKTVQEHPELTVEEIEARLAEEARQFGFELDREILDDLVIGADEINVSGGPVKAASEAVGFAVGRTGRSILTWMSEAFAFPPNMSGRPGIRAANMLLHLAGLLRIEAAEHGREPLAKRLTSVIDFIQGYTAAAPPPTLEVKPLVPPHNDREPE